MCPPTLSEILPLAWRAELAENLVVEYKKHEAEDLRVPPEELAGEHTAVRACMIAAPAAAAPVTSSSPAGRALHFSQLRAVSASCARAGGDVQDTASAALLTLLSNEHLRSECSCTKQALLDGHVPFPVSIHPNPLAARRQRQCRMSCLVSW